MTAPVRPRTWRSATVLPTVLTAVLGGTVVLTVTSAGSSAGSSAASPAIRAVSYADGNPMGGLNVKRLTPGGLHVTGWSFDPDARHSTVRVYARIDGKPQPSVAADLDRPDVAHYYPSAGAAHGFDETIAVPEGTHTVCVRSANIGRGALTELGCRTATFSYGPLGSFESLSQASGAIRLAGWALDGDTMNTPLAIRVGVDGAVRTITANGLRTDIAKLHPHTGTNHGFALTVPVAQGKHTVCVTAVNTGYGHDTNLGCRTVTLDERPVGATNVPEQKSGAMRVWGWAWDPDARTTPLKVTVTVDSRTTVTLLANRSRPDVARYFPRAGALHGFDTTLTLAEGRHTICATAVNVGYGSNRALGCRTGVLNFTPSAALTTAVATSTGLSLRGWATDPDTTRAIATRIVLDGRTVATTTANAKGSTHSGHNFTGSVPAKSGKHVVCAIALNTLWGTRNSTPSCKTVTLALKPIGAFESLGRVAGSTALAVTGYAVDPDTTSALSITATVDGHAIPALKADAARPDIAKRYPGLGADHGLAAAVPATDGEHTVCLTAVNVGGGSNTALGCKIINAVHPVAPLAPGTATAVAGFGGATVSWTAPTSDGGAPVSGYTVISSPGNVSVTVPAGSTSAVVVGLKAGTTYTFAVVAINVAGRSLATVSSAVRTQTGPPAQRTPAPISTSRYIRNVRGSSATDLATMRAEGVTDAKHNASGHGYLVLLDIGGQDAYDNGVVLSAGVRFVSYYDLVRDVQAYLDGYASAQKASAPVVIAVGTNNDMDVSAATGKVWATKVVNPLVTYAKRHIGMTIAGANDIEPGFRASYTATRNWLSGYLSATGAPFIFNGSADGCAWTTTNRRCNNGWTMAGLHYLAAGAAPTRMLNLPQIYNNTMADQWKYISLTGVVNHLPRINFAGVLTEYTACAQAGSCGSITGRSAWSRLWSDLQSDARLKVSSLPYATDLRIDR